MSSYVRVAGSYFVGGGLIAGHFVWSPTTSVSGVRDIYVGLYTPQNEEITTFSVVGGQPRATYDGQCTYVFPFHLAVPALTFSHRPMRVRGLVRQNPDKSASSEISSSTGAFLCGSFVADYAQSHAFPMLVCPGSEAAHPQLQAQMSQFLDEGTRIMEGLHASVATPFGPPPGDALPKLGPQRDFDIALCSSRVPRTGILAGYVLWRVRQPSNRASAVSVRLRRHNKKEAEDLPPIQTVFAGKSTPYDDGVHYFFFHLVIPGRVHASQHGGPRYYLQANLWPVTRSKVKNVYRSLPSMTAVHEVEILEALRELTTSENKWETGYSDEATARKEHEKWLAQQDERREQRKTELVVRQQQEQKDAQPIIVDEVFENQRRPLLGSWAPPSQGSMPAFCDAAGNHKLRDDSCLPGQDWQWTDNWRVDSSSSKDSDGWMYAFTWPDAHTLWRPSDWSPSSSPKDFVRRRRWIRTRVSPSRYGLLQTVQAEHAEALRALEVVLEVERNDDLAELERRMQQYHAGVEAQMQLVGEYMMRGRHLMLDHVSEAMCIRRPNAPPNSPSGGTEPSAPPLPAHMRAGDAQLPEDLGLTQAAGGTNSGGRDPDEALCCVCMENEKDTVLLPCSHLAVCNPCSQTLSLCPVCRTAIESKVRVYQ
eukprot:TRINITY_DN6227_c0_g1_i1.p1 TRINITY_DN6227_c0_g1~~TRINITY_DN6227_c0_g1_i1.p1  ORF type:complete len:650 (-),score=60.58 TRINITY_DN6227_c0_g1_i1:19-1968(-)